MVDVVSWADELMLINNKKIIESKRCGFMLSNFPQRNLTHVITALPECYVIVTERRIKKSPVENRKSY